MNEVVLDSSRHLLFTAAGKSDLQVLDVSTPSAPVRVAEYGGVANNLGTWGVSLQGDELFLSHTCAVIPFSSTWAGVKALKISN